MIALVTGASSGIGRELARLLARDGYSLVLVARGSAGLSEVAAELRSGHGATVTAIPANLSIPAEIDRLLEKLRMTGTQVDVLVNNAGSGGAGRFAETDLAGELAMIALNVAAVTHLTKALLPAMLARRHGRILNVASTASFQPGPYMAVYYATKAYLLSFSDALAEELKGSGVTVTTLCPGPTRTAFAARAGMRPSRLARSGAVMDAAPVAVAGYQALMRGQRLVVPGFLNKLTAHGGRFLPRSLVIRASAALNRGRADR